MSPLCREAGKCSKTQQNAAKSSKTQQNAARRSKTQRKEFSSTKTQQKNAAKRSKNAALHNPRLSSFNTPHPTLP